MDGNTVREGRLEVCINRAWGTVYECGFGIEDAKVMCQELGFSRRGESQQPRFAETQNLNIFPPNV